MTPYTLYHNPRCSKSRQALALLQERGIEPTVVEYLKDVPTVESLQQLMLRLAIDDPRAMMRTKEPIYAELNLADEGLTEHDLLVAISDHPILLERPILIKSNKAVIGRPTEALEALL